MYIHTPGIILALNVLYFFFDCEIDRLFDSQVRGTGEGAAEISLWTHPKTDLFLNLLHSQVCGVICKPSVTGWKKAGRILF